jgi:hypothetical protein
MSEVILNLVPRKKKKGIRTSAKQEIMLQNYLQGESLLTHVCKVLTFNLHQSNTSLLKCNGHCELYNIHRILVFRRAELERKFCFHQRYLYSTSYLCSQLILESQTEHSFSVTLQYYKSCTVCNNTHVSIYY